MKVMREPKTSEFLGLSQNDCLSDNSVNYVTQNVNEIDENLTVGL
jgi:hypothetical protein